MPARLLRWFASFVLGLAVSYSVLNAADRDLPWAVRVWKEEDGLGANNVRSILQTPDGLLWFVAGGKLSRFDGSAFEHYPLAGLAEKLDPQPRAGLLLRDGGMAFLLDGGLLRVAAGKAEYFATESPSSRVETIVEDGNGGFLISHNNEAVHRSRPEGVTALNEDHGLPPRSGTGTTLAVDREGTVWMARAGHLGVIHNGRFQKRFMLPDRPTRLAAAADGGLWVCAGLQLLKYETDGTMRSAGHLPAQNLAARPSALLEDRSGAVWIGTSISGLYRYHGSAFESVPISHREVVTLTEDREGHLWVATSGGGANLVLPRTISVEGEETGVPFRAVQAICEDPAGVRWAVSQDGSVVVRQGGAWQSAFPELEGLGTEASCIAADPEGGIWIGTRNQQLVRWHNGQFTTWARDTGMMSVLTRTLFVSRSGDVWIGSGKPGALYRFRNGTLSSLPIPETIDSIWGIAEDAAGNIWAGGTRGMLLRVAPDDRVVDETWRTAAPRDHIRALHATPDGSLWIGYEQSGAGRLTADRFTLFTTGHGLVADNLRHIVSDGRGWLWFISVQTVSKIRQSELEQVAAGNRARLQPVQYGRDEGLHVILGNMVGPLLSRDGRLWLPLATSLAIFNPELEHRDQEPPPVLITRVAVDQQVAATYGGALPAPNALDLRHAALRLPPDHRRVELDFTALSFSAPKNVRFRYRLENFDDSWIDNGTQRRVTYSRLAAGNYRFLVKACNSDGVWNETGATLAFAVEPFLWETWWFRGALLAVFTSAVFGTTRWVSLRRLRTKFRALEQETALERERSRIARDIHDDLGSRLTKIVLLSGLATRQGTPPEKTTEQVHEISETARQLMKSLDETVWAVSPRNDNLPHLIDYMSQFAVTFLRTAEIACVLDLPDDPPPLPVSADVRHNVYMAVKEALTNVVRHAQATEVRLSVTVGEGELQIVIHDNGHGFDGAAPGDDDADGLRNMRERMMQIGGKFEVVSHAGSGTRISLRIACQRPR